MAIDADNGEDLPMNPSISLYITVDNAMEMERLFNGLKKEGAILMPKLQCHHSANSHGCKINLALVFNLRYLKINRIRTECINAFGSNPILLYSNLSFYLTFILCILS